MTALAVYILGIIAFVLSLAVLAVRAFVPLENQPMWFSSALEAEPWVVPSLMFFVAWVCAMSLLVDCYLLALTFLALARAVLKGLRLPLVLAFVGLAAVAADYTVAGVYGWEPHAWALCAADLWNRSYGWVLERVVAGDWVSAAGDLVRAVRHLQIPALR